MQREIKFRMFDCSIPEMILNQRRVFECLSRMSDEILNHELIFMQSTGLKDFDGAEIFEHDVLQLPGHDPKRNYGFGDFMDGKKIVIEWCPIKSGFCIFKLDEYKKHLKSEREGVADMSKRRYGLKSFLGDFNIGFHAPVIGNIWENPELLGE